MSYFLGSDWKLPRETLKFLGGLLKPPRNICFLECGVAPPRKVSFPWRFDFGPQEKSRPPRQFQFPVVIIHIKL